MNTPPFLLAAAALFWGYETDNWLVAAASAALLEAPRYIARRWQLESAEFNRVADFCTVLLLAIATYLYFTFGNPRAITLLFQWMPVIVLPLALAQAWSTARAPDGLRLSACESVNGYADSGQTVSSTSPCTTAASSAVARQKPATASVGTDLNLRDITE